MTQNGAGPLLINEPHRNQIYVHFGDKPYTFLINMDKSKSLSFGKNIHHHSPGPIGLNSSLASSYLELS